MKDLDQLRRRWARCIGAAVIVSSALAAVSKPALAGMNTIVCPNVSAGTQDVPECGGQRATCVGSTEDDLIVGTDGKDVISGGPGADVIIGHGGRDVLCGGPGDDEILSGGGSDEVHGDEGSDRLFGARGGDHLDGGPGDSDVLWGGPGSDVLDGGDGQHDVCLLQRELGEANLETCETIYPIPGYAHDEELEPGLWKPDEALVGGHLPAATIIVCPWIPDGLKDIPACEGREATCIGTEGNDLILGTGEDDVIWAGPGDDVIHADKGNDIVCGGPGRDSLMGAGGNDLLFGEDGEDWLYGATGNDSLFGGAGDKDLLWAGRGDNRLDGGPGSSDRCLLQGCNRSGPASGYGDPNTCETVYPRDQADDR